MTVLSRDALEASPLADLHAIASELAIDGFRRLRKADLVDAILGHQDAEDEGEAATTFEDAEDHEARPRRRRGGRGRGRRAVDADLDAGEETVEEPDEEAESDEVEADAVAAEQDAAEVAPPERRSRRGGAGRRSRGDEERADEAEPVAEGVVELAGNGAAFIRLDDQPD